MAKLNGPFPFTGSLGGLCFYKRNDVDGTMARAHSSLTKARFRSDPAFANSRRNAVECGGRSTAARMLRRVLHPLDPVRVGNWQAQLTRVLTPVQHTDTEGGYGQRGILFSRYGRHLEGLCLSRRTPFEAVMRSPLAFSLSKEALRADVSVPALAQGVNFYASANQACFCWTMVLGIVPDLVYTPQGYQPDGDYSQLLHDVVYSDWYPVKAGAPATRFDLQLTKAPPNESFGLLVAVGILFGSVNQWGSIEPVKYQGSGRIVAVV